MRLLIDCLSQEGAFDMKKLIAALLFFGSVLVGGLSVGAEAIISATAKAEIQFLPEPNNSLKSQNEQNKKKLDALKAEFEKIKLRAETVLTEVNTLQRNSKDIIAKLKVAKEKNDKAKIKVLNEALTKNQKAIKTKMASIQSDLERLKEIQAELKKLKSQIKSSKEQTKRKNVSIAVKMFQVEFKNEIHLVSTSNL
jgi:uncharacterized protein involved in exopolysaccharide biosynthesis